MYTLEVVKYSRYLSVSIVGKIIVKDFTCIYWFIFNSLNIYVYMQANKYTYIYVYIATDGNFFKYIYMYIYPYI